MGHAQLPVAGAPPPLPSPDVLARVRLSCQDLAYREASLADAFRESLAALAPDVVRELPDDGRPLCRRTVHALLEVGAAGARPQQLALLQQAGATNRLEGFPSEEYVSAWHALLRAMRSSLSWEWSTVLSSAWVEYYYWVRAHLLVGACAAEDVLAAQEAARRAEEEQARQADAEQARAAEEADDLVDDEEDAGYGEIMVSMTRTPRRGSSKPR